MNLLLKNIIDNDNCELCGSSAESPDHMAMHCPFAAPFWGHLGISIPPLHIPVMAFSSYLLLCVWQLWKHRNDKVFSRLIPSLARLLATCKDEAKL
uniref:Uncharacterized protein n=1 Tax=Setaria viridis TaxID=4556 RepID=A0A4U6U2E0_SETVI|nr:hypothetical protein SEVIR_6G061400v2 [Setaria viridis]